MKAGFRQIWLHLKGSYWFIPTLLTSLAVALSFLTIWLDLTGSFNLFKGIAWLEFSGVEGARGFLTVIASAMISIASTVFAITIAAVAYASGNYGPRLLTNFMNDRGNQVSLGVFIATFVYALIILRVIHEGEGAGDAAEFVPQLSLFVANMLVIYAVAQLVYFLHHIPASIRINTVLAGIGRKLLADIESRFPKGSGTREPEEGFRGSPITPDVSGYIEIIEFESLQEIAAKADALIVLHVRTGDFIHPGIVIAEVAGAVVDEKLAGKIRETLAVGTTRTRAQDLEYLIDELVEIALRALSSGINDPYTAVSSLHWLDAGLTTLASRDLQCGPEQDKYDLKRVRPLPDDFQHFLDRSFGALRNSAASNPIAAKIFLQSLTSVAKAAPSQSRKLIVAAEGEALIRQAEHALNGPALDELQLRFKQFRDELDKSA